MTDYMPNSTPNPNDPNQGEPTPSERINDALETTGRRIGDELNTAGERVRQFVEDNRINEKLEVAGQDLVSQVKRLVDEGNVRRLIIRNPEGRTLIEVPLTAGAVAVAAALWFMPMIAAVGVIGGMLARVTIEIVREEPDATVQDVKEAVDDVTDRLSGN